MATLHSRESDKTNRYFGDKDAHGQGRGARDLVLDIPENLPTKGLKRFKGLSNFRSFQAVNLVPRKNDSCPREEVLFLGDLEEAPLLLVYLTLVLVGSTVSELAGSSCDHW
jgi:hypothetical protein